ncbi:MAG TPA: anhydro-N-acetylmuramic acid kinase [Pseudonocardiaceae bacterium]|nr:anhydro-N-acetylmuramic acid kinase [Pseudonocardiaceae bacterium]
MRVIGLMSGTSYDAIDAAAADLTLDGDLLVLRPLGSLRLPMPESVRVALGAALPPAATTLQAVCELDTGIGQAFADAAERANGELCAGRADLVASHGQTVFHWVEGDRVRGTLQIGQPAWIAERTGLPVVADFRPRDVAAGGQGAPLVSVVDVLLLGGRAGAAVALNLGGIANLTVVAAGRDPIAFDTGPANALIDAATREYTGREYDVDGALAARGIVVPALLDRLLAEPYYARPAPKTTGKELFHLAYLEGILAGLGELAAEDVIATVTELTVRTVADAVLRCGATEVIASGGGTRNPVLMAGIARRLPGVSLSTSDSVGLPSADKEAYAFAVLGFLTAHQLPGTIASCTGARHASVLGAVTPGARPFAWPGADRAPVRLVIDQGAA